MFLSDEFAEYNNVEIINDEIAVETIYDELGNGNRYYFMRKYPKQKYISVTTLTKWSNPEKVVNINKYKSTKTEEEQKQLEEAWKEQRELGKRVHKALEKNDTSKLVDKKDVAYFNSYQKYINNIVLAQHRTEDTSIWSGDINGVHSGFAGTADAVHQIAYYNLEYYDDEIVANEVRNCVIDYKNPGKNHLNSHPEYGLEYYLQLAANTAALNKKTNFQYNCKDSLLVVSTQRTINIYYLTNELLCFYWKWFKQFLYNYTTNKEMSYEDKCTTWNKFAEEAVDYYPYRLKIKQLEHIEFGT